MLLSDSTLLLPICNFFGIMEDQWVKVRNALKSMVFFLFASGVL